VSTPTHHRARLAALKRHSPENTEAIEAAKADLAAANLAQRIREIVDSAPPLTDEQRDKLATLLRPSAAPSDVEGVRKAC
jgi:ribosome recycling factor